MKVGEHILREMCVRVTCNKRCIVCMFSYHTSQPVAWCIANSEISEVVEIFLSSMKARSPMTPVRVLMTDDGELTGIVCTKSK